MTTQLFEDLLKEVEEEFTGWDFSYITGTGRMGSGMIPWSYGSMAIPLIRNADSMLDMGTGGGELLSMLQPFPPSVCATEGYPPNVPVARERLEPLGVRVEEINEDFHLPFEDNQFDLIINKHESYSPAEVKRILSAGGTFLTQQVGGDDCNGINIALGVPIPEDYTHWTLEYAVQELEKEGFEVSYSNRAYSCQRFYDIGALVYYIKAIPWQIPDFSVEAYRDSLYRIYQLIQEKGFFEVKQHRFIIKASLAK
ncbi:class I SAM-dependent methyltransferase [Bacillus sp. KH172YL63]|uniref:class I SAM-dependent methyltransferase n=1 Tax=Bacillus sp. KH172YL63 TaxID=2709784 RepID=UPI0013E4EF78|nr:class I SAM-dependent methyltransferase [Bacillus sp. KH172YL63]BCB03725.1 methyltransferase [Bacillus sp. KH172YL63]